MRKLLTAAGTLVLLLSLATPAQAAPHKRTVVYYQTQYSNGATGDYVSPLPLLTNNTGVTDVIVAAIHLNADKTVHLNDHPPSHERYTRMWQDLKSMRDRGVNVIGMVGGAAQGTYANLERDFATFYPLLKNVITTYGLNGVDLDVEEKMSQAGITKLIDALRKDFGSGFLITLAPVASALHGGGNISGFNYETLYRERGSQINWFNAQFYCGWGSMADTAGYDRIIGRKLIPPAKVVAGVITNPASCGGYVELDKLKSTIKQLTQKYPTFGGVDGWEYFNSNPGGTARPWEWAKEITSAMR
ncbi:glycosyl hydrolase family 18 protein [Crossiella sp. CA-258035]|uniref:glycosyl hydrolase family 18 protein n=1 Tax=Crossiella sp. CA-258035 TaxID=2981138 RepID=UPI0024BCB7A8|nr:glycosyl hydrolase family 18 protein [Crossiella sp. CA-258035]WHT18794.1 glycosyl hydrolase family 18 protein [Crossiella sp. CA-258035]